MLGGIVGLVALILLILLLLGGSDSRASELPCNENAHVIVARFIDGDALSRSLAALRERSPAPD